MTNPYTNRSMRLAFKILLFLFLTFCFIIFLLYFFNHYSNEDLISKAKKHTNENKENYWELYNFLKEATNDSIDRSAIDYRSGLGNCYLTVENDKMRRVNKVKPEHFIKNISTSLMASYNRKYMTVSFPYSNYHLYHSVLIYPDNKDSVIRYYVSHGYTFYNSRDTVKYENAIIDTDNGWLLALHK